MRKLLFVILAIAGMTEMFLQASGAPVDPQVPKADRYTGDRVFLERASRLYARQGEDFQILVGDVEFRKADMFMYCDSAHFYTDNSLKAYGSIRMEQGDTLFVFADSLYYNDSLELATLYSWEGKKVELINRDVKLETEEFFYDLGIDLGYYRSGGILTDTTNRLISQEGEYSPTTKEANFYIDVRLNSRDKSGDTLQILTDTLLYNTATHVAELTCFSEIINSDGVLLTTEGRYNTESGFGELFSRSKAVMNRGTTLIGDTLIYDRELGYGEAFGNMELEDTAKKSILTGDYGFYDQLRDSAFVTGRALAMEYSSGDTLYLHGDTIRAFKVFLDEIQINDSTFVVADTTNHIVAYPRVRFYRTDMQGLCDSMTFVSLDSTLYLNHHPIVWSENRQIVGNEIYVHFNDSTVDSATLPNQALVAEEIEEGFYNQLKGREMIAYFDNGVMRHLDVIGNVQAVSFPMENDSTYNKVVTMESSTLSADFHNNALERMKIWPNVKSVVTPLYLAKSSIFRLPEFKWYEILRPTDPDDVFNVSQMMIDYLNQKEDESIRGKEPEKRTTKIEIPRGRKIEIRPVEIGSGSQAVDSIMPPVLIDDNVASDDTLPEAIDKADAETL
jgi:hypothetical protein